VKTLGRKIGDAPLLCGDEMVCELYGLTEEKIKITEGLNAPFSNKNLSLFRSRALRLTQARPKFLAICTKHYIKKEERFFMKNCDMKLTGNILTITVDVSKDFGKSSSGKSVIIASTEGNVSIPDKEDIKIGLNVYKKP
jgi:hypothetical protein